MSVANTVVKKIGSADYVIGKLPATKAMRVHLALGKAVLDALASGTDAIGEMVGAGKPGGKDGKAAPDLAAEEQERLLGMVLRLFTALPADDWTAPDGRRYMGLDNLSRLLLAHVKVGGKVEIDDPDAYFTNVGDMYLVLWEVLRHNFADFLGDVLSRSRQHAAKTA